jgi:hypothetical protein
MMNLTSLYGRRSIMMKISARLDPYKVAHWTEDKPNPYSPYKDVFTNAVNNDVSWMKFGSLLE